MYKEKNPNLAKKLKLKELGQIATEKINENKILLETLSLYQQKIDSIKAIMNKKNNNENYQISTNNNSLELNNTNDTSIINNNIKSEFISYYEGQKKFTETLRKSNKKLLQKYVTNNNIAFDETSLQKINLQKYRTDNFILYYDLRPKNDIIKKLNENITNSRRHSVFREMKREVYKTPIDCENDLNNDNLYLQRDLQIECKHYNKCINKLKKKNKKLKKIQQNEEYLQKLIDYFEKENNVSFKKKENSIFKQKKENNKNGFLSFSNKKKLTNNKRKNNMNNKNYNSITIDEVGNKYQFEEDLGDFKGGFNDDQSYLPNNGGINNLLFFNEEENKNNKKKEKKIKNKFRFLTVDELFDLENDESEKEVIIQDELHSDDEVVFEKKIKNKVRVNTVYLSEIKKQVPNLYLNQIEFNKKKIINEADLYSYQRRKYYKHNIDENIKLMKKRIKKLKKRLRINKEKLHALIEFDKKAKEKYEILKPLKVQTSLKDYNISFMKREFYNFRKNKNDIIAEVDEKNYENEERKDDENEEGEVDDYSDEMRKKNKYNKNDILETEVNNEEERKNEYADNYDFDFNKPKSK